MNKLFLILFLSFKMTGQVNKLPVPSKSFVEKVRYEDNFEEKYFSKYLGKKEEHILKRFSDSKEVCAKEYKFKTGIKLKNNSCSEAGLDVEIVFPNYSKSEVIKFVEWFFKTDDNVWNKLKTKYQPKEDEDAGCYLEIKESKGQTVLSYYCGC
ncbi:hypothetical protein IRZ71_12040 [Flavobacterium sp. ANB]|uniref:hypothetical protein n=1 Tax=unclassified Flavobacterium TaxID=196869 RepID=UPI0012B86EBD|nr:MULTISPECIES: hypothetical protein [unclassified Flavobacterium]MBF4517084.1 hypothetical protein [Flavobacterium sp. ANB]MTD71821.1 hypothetical protein [Flavobacterium sp. LC2016-13]